MADGPQQGFERLELLCRIGGPPEWLRHCRRRFVDLVRTYVGGRTTEGGWKRRPALRIDKKADDRRRQSSDDAATLWTARFRMKGTCFVTTHNGNGITRGHLGREFTTSGRAMRQCRICEEVWKRIYRCLGQSSKAVSAMITQLDEGAELIAVCAPIVSEPHRVVSNFRQRGDQLAYV